MKIRIKRIFLCGLTCAMLLFPVCSAFADSIPTEDEEEGGLVAMASLSYISALGASIQHDEETGYFYCGGTVIHEDKTNFRVKCTLSLLRSHFPSPNGMVYNKADYSISYLKPGYDSPHFVYRGYYDIGFSYCTKHVVECYQGYTSNVIETAEVYSLYISVSD